MTKDQIITELGNWHQRITESNETVADLLEPLMLIPESPLYQSIWSLQGGYTEAVAKVVGDEWEWLEWYYAENAMGASGMEASPGTGHKTREINNLIDLAQLIMESK